MKTCACLIAFSFALASAVATPLPLDPLWKSEPFRRALTASYGVDSRIEPRIGEEERAVLETIGRKMAEQDRKGAIAILAQSPLLNQSAALLFNLGNLRFEEDDLENARLHFAKALELVPNFRDAHRNLAMVLVRAETCGEAEPHLIRAIELGAQDGLSFGLLGYCHLQAGRHAAALQAYRMAQMTMPAEIQWKIGEAECLLALDATREAESIFAALLEGRPTDTGLWLNQAQVWLQRDETTKAAANLEFVRRAKALNAPGLMTLGHLYFNGGLKERALGTWEEALEQKPPPDLPSALSALERLTQAALWSEAKAWATRLQTAYPIAPDSKEASSLERTLALIELETGDSDRGRKLVEALVKRNPLDGQALFLLARFRLQSGAREEALQLLEQAALDETAAAQAKLLHGQVLVERREFEKALPLLEEALELRPGESLRAYVEEVRRIAGQAGP